MAILTLSNGQVIELVKQLPPQQQAEVFKYLILQQWSTWDSLSNYGTEKVRIVAQERGLNWDAMTEEERETFIDDVLHED
ncbi:hypothetical protein [Phormidium tenue]|uniref:DUF2281 domain-containing protein n=1 Tax=Phormidium tenue NIES-30 TaxID=549789 RepID=A0A1U7J506_9CYAN|nr:hypothetical protein [Phormidium tenue]MBD2232549.1 hypothetical protein [Phormidium tenue FACHB-1052]OKH47688.1 hypothetical protein NIES30_11905 [Phormidium tenue NIES-30]